LQTLAPDSLQDDLAANSTSYRFRFDIFDRPYPGDPPRPAVSVSEAGSGRGRVGQVSRRRKPIVNHTGLESAA
jgi:hypothetical protein